MLQRGNLMLIMSCVLLIVCLVVIARLSAARGDLEKQLDACKATQMTRQALPPTPGGPAEPGPSLPPPPGGEAGAPPPGGPSGPGGIRPPLAGVPGVGETPGALPPSVARLGLTPEARDFFQKHRGLAARAIRVMRAAQAKTQAGGDVSGVEDAFREAARAAGDADEKAVDRALTRAEKELGLPPAGEVEKLARGVRRLEEALSQAQAQGKDVRSLAPLLEQIRAALGAGDAKKAQELLETGMARLRRMKPGRVSGPPAPARGQGPTEPGPGPGMAGVLAAVMQREVRNLHAIDEDLTNAKLILESGTREQTAEVLDKTISELNQIRKRRIILTEAAEMAAERARERAGAPPGQQPPPEETGRAALPPSFDLEEARSDLFAAFDRVRSLPQDTYEADRQKLFDALLERMFPPRPVRPHMTAEQGALEAAAREKLRLAEEPLAKKKAAGEDVSDIDAKVERARGYLTDGQYELANDLATEILQSLGVAAPSGPAPEK